MTTNEIICLNRDVYALMVPSGAKILLHQGTEVTITQSLGNSYTINVFGNLARIESHDADALGKEAISQIAELPSDASIEDKVWAQLKMVFDPEIPVNIVDLGLVYECKIDLDDNQKYAVNITMTLTAPGCGMGPVIAEDAKKRVLALPEINDAHVEVVFDPPWSQEMMSDAAKLELGVFGY